MGRMTLSRLTQVRRSITLCTMLLLSAVAVPVTHGQAAKQLPVQAAPAARLGVFNAAEAGAVLPATVFFQGRVAPIQMRNSGGVRFSDVAMMLVGLVDTSGYSSAVQERYQAYLLTETALTIDGHTLAAGAYGVGFLPGDKFLVMDIGGHELFTAKTMKNAELRRPSPLQVLAGAAGEHRIYAGRSYVAFALAKP